MVLLSGSVLAQYAIGDYGSMNNGNWSNAIWGTWNGLSWSAVGSTPSSANNVWILSGKTVVLPSGGPYSCKNLVVESTGKLWTSNSGTNVYIYVYGSTLTCNGQIGDGANFDGISFGIEGTTTTITGSGQFDASRIRKNSIFNPTTNLIIGMNLNLRWNSASGTQLYNGTAIASSGPGSSIFNITINAFCTVNLIPNGPNIGNVCIDGLDGAQPTLFEAGGIFTVNGTLIISGKLYLTTNNTSTTYTCGWVINGLVQANEIVASASGTAFHSLQINSGGKLDITGSPAWSSLGTFNNTFNFANGSTVEYSSNGFQLVRVRSEFGGAVNNGYYNLILSNSGSKATQLTDLWVRNDILITGSAWLDPSPVNSNIFIGGNWTNYNSSGFLEKNTICYFNGAGLQSINCPGGEVYYTLRYNKTASYLQFNNPVDVIQQLIFASNGYVDLNSNTLTVRNPAFTGITGATSTRYIVSEKTDNSSKIVWKIGTGTGNYNFPFGVSPLSTANYIPVLMVKSTANDIGDVTLSTYGTPPDNLPWPTTPTAVSNLQAYFSVYNNPDNRHYTVDRFWEIGATSPQSLTSLTLTYRTSELPDLDPDPLHQGAQFWAGAYQVWNLTQWGTSGANASTDFVTVPAFSYYNTSWTITSLTSPLPIELVSFQAIPLEEKVDLKWTTSSETNNNFFTVEKSLDGKDFFEIGIVEGAHNSTETRNYQLPDKNPVYGISYYRLKQTDFDGKYTYSDIVPVKYNKNSGHYSVYPNPADDNAYILSEVKTKSTITVRASDGRVVQQLEVDGTKQITQLSLAGLSSGMYILEIKSEGETQFLRLVKR
jgi:hypothetical protein